MVGLSAPYTFLFRWPQRKKSKGVKSQKLGGQLTLLVEEIICGSNFSWHVWPFYWNHIPSKTSNFGHTSTLVAYISNSSVTLAIHLTKLPVSSLRKYDPVIPPIWVAVSTIALGFSSIQCRNSACWRSHWVGNGLHSWKRFAGKFVMDLSLFVYPIGNCNSYSRCRIEVFRFLAIFSLTKAMISVEHPARTRTGFSISAIVPHCWNFFTILLSVGWLCGARKWRRPQNAFLLERPFS